MHNNTTVVPDLTSPGVWSTTLGRIVSVGNRYRLPIPPWAVHARALRHRWKFRDSRKEVSPTQKQSKTWKMKKKKTHTGVTAYFPVCSTKKFQFIADAGNDPSVGRRRGGDGVTFVPSCSCENKMVTPTIQLRVFVPEVSTSYI